MSVVKKNTLTGSHIPEPAWIGILAVFVDFRTGGNVDSVTPCNPGRAGVHGNGSQRAEGDKRLRIFEHLVL